MRRSEFFLPTLKEVPSDAEIRSHQLMLRAGLIRRLASGIYYYLPFGFRVLQRIIGIVREEMNGAGAQEVLLPAVHPKELWDESGRWDLYGEDMFHLFDRKKRPFCLAPTHEEAITNLVRNEVRSYKELPLLLYQIQTKFRDEPRPRFGMMRCREFLMKDAYSFHRDDKCLQGTYKKVYDAYVRIFRRCGLDCEIVEADPGLIGGGLSHEFMVLAPSGEDIVVLCPKCGYRANADKPDKPSDVERQTSYDLRRTTHDEMKEVNTPDMKTVEQVSAFLKVKPSQLVKTLIYYADGKPVAVLVPGDREVNEAKLMSVLKTAGLKLASADQIEELTGGPMGFSGPVGLKAGMIADHSVAGMSDFVTGANKKDTHLFNVNPDRDFKIERFEDLTAARDGDPCPKCGAGTEVKTGIELGHTFNLGTRYSSAMKAKFLDEDGKEKIMVMGCYGIGVSRIIAAVIEQHNDENGIIWPFSIAPFSAVILPLNMNDETQKKLAEEIYEGLTAKGADVLLDDRNEPAGVKFKDADLTGIPVKVVLGDRALKEGKVEVQLRSSGEKQKVEKSEAVSEILKLIKL
ncbi:proline--tRNA ligase [Candidatus Desantisbacteria bacterium CG_4_10_14_0_8_um_filter_48_22]|uniref:Proline--tRNA ligase n=1 Tax=Candidatus Desantisbacteria bacterium CG_4_10_14_0_8_um_filter_48_22 TaxID=1974543 RepID=A0A2M7SAK9_9BACT|nr:MAG: proline--tRNA ligase [Candidatus Desantisbacteria bacterium CG1_02_49_89]PIV56348.1 MAG: proline--tRNA ligase [Candidatus Desantisbacteria bacterium CG02_land_8_20_14_3_00_49_13]PIZ16521.1 MAG: proline--tRNA ligase [Candidatus Desantisbacteria bacterium CG_4_10_14_0_8_um_filter_48_22]